MIHILLYENWVILSLHDFDESLPKDVIEGAYTAGTADGLGANFFDIFHSWK